jgi:putative transposase
MDDEGDQDRSGWDEACRREAAIRSLIDRYPTRLNVAAVEDVAWELGVSRATLYETARPGLAECFRELMNHD